MPRTSGDPLRDAFRDKLDAVISAAGITWPVQDTLNTGEQPGAASAFIDIEFHGGQETYFSFGNPGGNTFKETGQVMIRLFPPRNTGHDTAERYGLAIRTGFRAARFAMSNGQSVKITATAPMGGGMVDGAWWCETIAIQYQTFPTG